MNKLFAFEETEKVGLRKGIAFYFNDWIDEKIISALEEIIEKFLLMARAEFTQKHSGRDYDSRRNIRGGWRKIFHREFDAKDFTESHILVLDDCSPQRVQSVLAGIHPNNFRSADGSYFAYSCLYLQSPLAVEWADVYRFMEYVNDRLSISYASAGYDTAYNARHQAGATGSVGASVRVLNNLKYANSDSTEWMHLYLSSRFGVPCPNFIQILSPCLSQKIDCSEADGISIKSEKGNLFLDILERTHGLMQEPAAEQTEARLKKLYRMLKPVIVTPERSIYMKPSDWNERLNRFD